MIKDNVFGTDSDVRFCPVCRYLGRFDASGSKKNSICPECGSTERARLYFMYLQSIGLGVEKTKVLHILPEQSIRYKINNDENIDYLPAGLSDVPAMLGKRAKFDLIMANYVVDRVEDDASFVELVRKSLSKGGRAMMSVHIHDKEDLAAKPKKYGPDYAKMLEADGYSVEVMGAADLCGLPLVVLCGIPETEKIIVVRND